MRYIDSGTRDPTQALGFWLELNVFRDVSLRELRWQSGFFEAGSLGYFIPTMARLKVFDGVLNVLVGSNDGMTRREDIEALIDAAGPPRKNQQLGVVKFRAGYFHPKTVHIVREDGSSAAYVGSANLTTNGVTSLHVEAGLLLDTRERDDAGVLREISQAIDVWFTTPRKGLNVVTDANQLEELVRKGILGVPIPATPPLQGAAKLGNIFARRLNPLVGVPAPPPVPVPAPAPPPIPAPAASTLPAVIRKQPPSTSVVEDSWWKQLTRSDAQRKNQGNQRGSITLVQGGRYIDAQTYFRNSLFKNATWVAQRTRTGQKRETATIPFEVHFLGRNLGVLNVEITYASNREAAQANYTSLLHLAGRLASEFSARDVTGKYFELRRNSDGYALSITDAPPKT
jgi:hypothetical protein